MFENNGYKLVSSDYEFGKDYYYSAEDAKNSFKVHLTRLQQRSNSRDQICLCKWQCGS